MTESFGKLGDIARLKSKGYGIARYVKDEDKQKAIKMYLDLISKDNKDRVCPKKAIKRVRYEFGISRRTFFRWQKTISVI